MDGLPVEDVVNPLDQTKDVLILSENCDVSDEENFDIHVVENGRDQISLCNDPDVGNDECYLALSPSTHQATSIPQIPEEAISIKVRKYLCKHCGYATMTYSNIMYHLKYVHPEIAASDNGKPFQHYKAILHPQGIKKVPLMYFCPYCNYITLDTRHFMLHSKRTHPKRKANPYKQGSPVTTAANRKYLEALCLAKDEPMKSKIKAHRLLTMYHPDSKLLQRHVNDTPISCFVCQTRFDDRLQLSKHYESKHSQLGKDSVTRNSHCKICSYVSATKMGLYKHYFDDHFINLYDSWYRPTPNSVLQKKKRNTKKIYDGESTQEFLEKVDESLLTLLNFENASDVHIAEYHIPCVACDFSSENLLFLLKHYKQNHGGRYPKRFELFLTEKFRAYIKTFLLTNSVADFIEKEKGAWITDNRRVTQYHEYTCKLCGSRYDWLSQIMNHFKDSHYDTKFSLKCVKKIRSLFPSTSISSFLQCSVCYHVEFTRIDMAVHYQEKHDMLNYDVEMDETFNLTEKRLCDGCSTIGNFDALQWHSFENHCGDIMAWGNLCSANDGICMELTCSVCRYIPSDDVDLIMHYQSKHIANAMTYTYSSTDNLYRCLHCGLEMMSLMDIASHCDFCLSKGQECVDQKLKYSTCKVCRKVFTAEATDATKWKHIVEQHCSNTIPFTIYDLPSFTQKYGFWDIGESTSHESLQSMRYNLSLRSANSDDNDVYASRGSDDEADLEVTLQIENIHSLCDIEQTAHEVSVKKLSVQTQCNNNSTAGCTVVEETSTVIDDNARISGDCVAVVKYVPENMDSNCKTSAELHHLTDMESTPLKVLSPDSHDFDTLQDTDLTFFDNSGKNIPTTQDQSGSKQTAQKSFPENTTKIALICRYCSKIFTETNKFQTHLGDEHGCTFRTRCFGCNATFTNPTHCIFHHEHIHGIIIDTRTVFHFLLDDIAVSAGHEEKFFCVWCGFESYSKIIVLNHYKSRHVSNLKRKHRHFKNGSYSCRWCEYVSKNITSTRAHIKAKHGKVISYRSLGHFTCREDIMLSDSSDSGDSKYRPPVKWRKKYQNRAKRLRDKTFILTQVCDYKYDTEYSNADLFKQTHVRYKHHNQYPFVCSFCKKSFVCSTAYLNHCKMKHRNLCLIRLRWKHVVQLPAPAVIAQFVKSQKQYQDRGNVKSVFYGNHWPCKLCLEEFHSLDKLQEHNFQMHPKQRAKKCRYCDFTSMEDEEIVHHAKFHNGFQERSIESPPDVQILKTGSSSTPTHNRTTKNARKSIRRSCLEISTQTDSRPVAEGTTPIILHNESSQLFITQFDNDDEESSKKDSTVHRVSCQFCSYSCDDLETLDGHLANFHKIKKNYQLAIPAGTSSKATCSRKKERADCVENKVIYISDSHDEHDNDNQAPDSCQKISILPLPEREKSDSSNLSCPYCGLNTLSISILKRHMQRHES